ncbi:MAG TPA: polysaccharide pyruvyl transferase family protein [Syntrophales bacterium]|nr:polysaccharide pyruvyl transferase family protein [Syntrophales bacterium]
MRKIGILTYFWADNPGTFLQAYSTYRAISQLFPEDRVELINYKHRYVFYKPSLGHILTGKFMEGYKRHVQFQGLIHDNLPLSRHRITSRDRLSASDYIRRQNYDLIVVGSDTVLQMLPFHFKKNEVPIYWLPANIPCRKVVCAASSSALSIRDLTESQIIECRNSMEHYDFIGVRDDATYSLLSSLGIRNMSSLEIIPDPTFSMDIDYSHIENLFGKTGFEPDEKSVVIDLPRRFTAAHQIADHFRARGYRIISLVPADYADYCFINVSPFEWAGIYRYCELVITQRFHGTIYSLKNFVPVMTVVWTDELKSREGLSKHRSLLKSFGMDEFSYIDGGSLKDPRHVFTNSEKVMAEFDRDTVIKNLERHRNAYLEFIHKIPPLIS